MRNFKKAMGIILALCFMLSVASVTVFAAESYTAAGTFPGSNWQVDNADYDLVLNDATGLYELKIDNVDAGTYEYKIVEDHSWDVSYNTEGSAIGLGTNASFTVDVDGSSVLFTFDPANPKAVARVIAPGSDDDSSSSEIVDGDDNDSKADDDKKDDTKVDDTKADDTKADGNKNTETKVDAPKTGDASMVLGLALILVSSAFVVAKKRASAK